jgi:lipopolysaccharide heptosyltransferase II
LNFLIIQTAFIGDVILATPLIEKLKRFFPDAQIDFLVRKGNEKLLENHPHLNHILVWNKKQNKLLNLLKIISEARKNKYDAVINLQRFASTGIITVFSGAKRKIGFDKNPFSFLFNEKIKHAIGEGKHEVNRNLDLIKSLADDRFIMPKLYPSENDYETVKKYKLKKYVCIAPTSVWFTKQLPGEKWMELIEKTNPDYSIYLLGSNEDFNSCEGLLKKSQHKNIINLAGKISLLQTAALMKDAKMNYVNDSAPLHIASAMNAPVTAFFCSTIPGFGFGPLSVQSKIVETELKLNCRPCGLHGYKNCPLGHFNCAKTILITDALVTAGQ